MDIHRGHTDQTDGLGGGALNGQKLHYILSMAGFKIKCTVFKNECVWGFGRINKTWLYFENLK